MEYVLFSGGPLSLEQIPQMRAGKEEFQQQWRETYTYHDEVMKEILEEKIANDVQSCSGVSAVWLASWARLQLADFWSRSSLATLHMMPQIAGFSSQTWDRNARSMWVLEMTTLKWGDSSNHFKQKWFCAYTALWDWSNTNVGKATGITITPAEMGIYDMIEANNISQGKKD